MMPMRRNEQISPEAVSVLKFPLKMSKAGKILRENYNEGRIKDLVHNQD